MRIPLPSRRVRSVCSFIDVCVIPASVWCGAGTPVPTDARSVAFGSDPVQRVSNRVGKARGRGRPPRGMTMAYATANGVELYYEVHGAGAPLVLLHGALGTIESCFGALLPTLARDRHVVAVEMQGHGHTPDTDRPLTFEHLADDVAALMHSLGLASADVVGYSV